MSSKNKPPFPEKHPPHEKPDAKIAAAVQEALSEGKLACAVAFHIAAQLNTTPQEIGKAADLLDVKLAKCQLGLFGYQPQKKIVKAQTTSHQELLDAIQAGQEEGSLACQRAWQIADQFNMGKLAVSNVAQGLKIKIKDCPLGAF